MLENWNILMVGVLANDEEIYEIAGRQSVFINAQNSLQFNVKLISEKPESFPNNNYYTCYTSDIDEYEFEDDLNLSNYERIERLKEFLDKYLFIFKPEKKGDHYKVSQTTLMLKPLKYNSKSTYIGVPVFSEKSHGIVYEEFKQKLLMKKYVGRIDKISHYQDDTPPFIIWLDKDNSYKIIGEFNSHLYAYGGFQFEFDELRWILSKSEWENDIIPMERDNLLFIGADEHLEMYEELKYGKLLNEEHKEVDNDNEAEFIENLNKIVREMGLFYNEIDLLNFHTAMKSSKLVILSGMSGTGKSKLVQAYGKALHLDDTQLKIIPVRPMSST
ncbi:MAG: hypothetical protein ACLUDK_05880 [Clostridium paraputrificum]